MKKMVKNLAVAFSAALALGMMGCKQVHECSFDTNWSSDAEKHWHECFCGEKSEEAEHTFGEWSEGKKSCSICGYEVVCQHRVKDGVCEICGADCRDSVLQLPAGTDGTLGTSGTYVLFGCFPQTIKEDGVTVDETKKKEMGYMTYYLGSDGSYYAKCLENAYVSDYKYSDGTTVAQKSSGSYRYFKVEPIKWRVLTNSYNGKKLLLAENAMTANVPYYESTSNYRNGKYVNNYEHSQIRAYLNGISYNAATASDEDKWKGKGFLQTAFTEKARGKIADTVVDNGGESTTDAGHNLNWANGKMEDGITDSGEPDYTCTDTTDKVFLLSEKEATTTVYGFSDYKSYGEGNSRIRVTTDYARANSAFQSSSSEYGGFWWLRSPLSTHGSYAYAVNNLGYSYGNGVESTERIVVPALSISFGN